MEAKSETEYAHSDGTKTNSVLAQIPPTESLATTANEFLTETSTPQSAQNTRTGRPSECNIRYTRQGRQILEKQKSILEDTEVTTPYICKHAHDK